MSPPFMPTYSVFCCAQAPVADRAASISAPATRLPEGEALRFDGAASRRDSDRSC